MNDYILNDYFDWLYYMVTRELGRRKKSYRKLLTLLHAIDFRYSVDYDENRAYDGTSLRWYYVDDGGDDEILSWKAPCTVLEMLIGLAIKIESIMETADDDHGVHHWFWIMLDNLDLKNMNDKNFDKIYVMDRINMFLDRTYEPDGNGNIIFIEDSQEDLREVEIWNQACWYLDTII